MRATTRKSSVCPSRRTPGGDAGRMVSTDCEAGISRNHAWPRDVPACSAGLCLNERSILSCQCPGLRKVFSESPRVPEIDSRPTSKAARPWTGRGPSACFLSHLVVPRLCSQNPPQHVQCPDASWPLVIVHVCNATAAGLCHRQRSDGADTCECKNRGCWMVALRLNCQERQRLVSPTISETTAACLQAQVLERSGCRA
jgi:hypothetical protein